MPISETEYIWMDGEMVPWRNATVHVLSHALHYGTSFFEGIRVYDTPVGPSVFRLNDHIDRLFDSAAIYGCEIPFEPAVVSLACEEVISRNNLQSAYLRPIVFYGYGEIGVAPGDTPVQVVISGFPW